MTAPAAQPEPGGAREQVTLDRASVRAAVELIADGPGHDERVRAAAYDAGRRAHLAGGYDEGYALGHDTGYSARQDTRAYVHGILDGFAAGCEARHQLIEHLLRSRQAKPAARQPDREAEAS